ncbi:acyl-CoA thioesterase [Peribacillus saganii]|uniref:Acyl-CoA thioesterase n=1 Tax=Peribacillus saganii TaxID=2303992 RepID=A0A372LR30_9BACI|nr:thioesterase family protein [Peribacillus saganii]RFU70689.1 acyl-CoA thioesterase [Peribacillus saganii]
MSKIAYIPNIEEWEKSFSFKNEVKVRFSETDMFGHLNNTVPFTYFEEARIEFFNSLGLMQDWVSSNSDTIPVVADLQCDFMKQVFFDETLLVYVKANSVGSTSVDVHYMGKKEDGTICFTGRGTMVQISRKNGKPVKWSDETKYLLLATEHSKV